MIGKPVFILQNAQMNYRVYFKVLNVDSVRFTSIHALSESYFHPTYIFNDDQQLSRWRTDSKKGASIHFCPHVCYADRLAFGKTWFKTYLYKS